MSDNPIHIISLGAGVQSSTMALMAAKGEITPMPVAAVFADTQAEPASVYRWLDWLERQLPFPVIRVSRGNLTKVALQIRCAMDGRSTWVKTLIPTYVRNPDGSRGILGRRCTYDYKVREITKAARRIMRESNATSAVQWIGISLDEVYRMKDSRFKGITHRWPLIERRVRRGDCLAWMEAHGYPKPPRSACKYCPFHSDAEWRRLKMEEPDEFRQAVEFEMDLQKAKQSTGELRGVPYLHSSLKPLNEIDFRAEEETGQGSLWGNECEGMCGV